LLSRPEEVNWAAHYPAIESEQRQVKIVDVGMGFGGLTIALAALFPDKLVLGTVVASAYCGCALLRHGGFSAKQSPPLIIRIQRC